MPVFDTPQPIVANIEPVVGNVRVIATERSDTVVDVRPSDPTNASDVKAAEQTRVEFSGGTLSVKGPRMLLDFSNKSRSIDVTVELPAGSRLHGSTGLGDLHGTGPVREVHYRCGAGHIQVERAGEVKVHTAAGNVVVERADGTADISTGSGRIHAGSLGGTAVVKNSNGATTVASAGGALRVRSANGDITVDHAANGVEAKTANGAVRVLDAVRGTLTLETAMGDIEIGIHESTAAWLDVKTHFGRVRNDMDATDSPDAAIDKVEAHANTAFGDITIHRS